MFKQLLFPCVLGLAWLAPLPATAEDAALATATATYAAVPSEYTVDSTVEAVNQSTVSAQTVGQITEIYFDVDDYVHQGQVLLRIKNTEQKAGVAETDAQLREAQARHREAQVNYERIKEAYAKQALPKVDMDSASANLEAARARLSAAQAGTRKSGQQLEYTEVKAPYSGIVVERHAELGEMANIGQPLMTGFSLDKLRAIASVPQNLVEAVRERNQARVIVRTLQEQRSIPADKLTILPYADAQGHTFKVRVDLPENTEKLYPGMFVKVAFVTGEEKRLLIPLQAVAFRGEVRAVYVQRDGQLSMRQVRLGERFADDTVEVLAGLDEGEQVALDPVKASVLLKEGRGGK